MALTEQKKQEWEETLRKGELISVSDKITDHTQGDLWEMLSQTRGNFFLTETNLIFVGGLLGAKTLNIPFNKITGLSLCNVGGLIPIMPTGIKVAYTDEKVKTVQQNALYLKEKHGLNASKIKQISSHIQKKYYLSHQRAGIYSSPLLFFKLLQFF